MSSRISSLKYILSVASLFSLIPGSTHAGILANAPEAFNNGSGPNAGTWNGSVDNIANIGPFGSIDADIDFAVFAPGNFQTFLDNNFGPSTYTDANPSNFVYAYQVTMNSVGLAGGSILTVGIGPSDPRTPPSFLPGSGDQSPGLTPDQVTSMEWNFEGQLTGGEVSDILFFSSPMPPELDFAQMNSGLASPSPSPLVPSPVPEPTALTLLMLASAIAVGKRR